MVVIEDLISTGKSSLQAVDALIEAGANVKGMAAIFTYGFDVASANFNAHNVELFTLSNYPTLLEQAVKSNYISASELETVKEWSKSPGSAPKSSSCSN